LHHDERPAHDSRKPAYLSNPFLESLSITTAEVIDSIERLVVGERRGQVWSAPKAVLLPGDERYIMATLAATDEPRIVVTKSLVLNPRNPARGIVAKAPAFSQRSSRKGRMGNKVTDVTTRSAEPIASLALWLATAVRPRASANPAQRVAVRGAAPEAADLTVSEQVAEGVEMAARLDATR